MPLKPSLLQLVNGVTGTAGWSGRGTVRFLAVHRAGVRLGWSARGTRCRTGRRGRRWTGNRRGTWRRAHRWIQRADAAGAGWSDGTVAAGSSWRWTDRRHDGAFLRRLSVGLGQ